MYQSTREPIIRADDLPEVSRLLGIYDRITFNGFGEMVAVLDQTMPVIGEVCISLFVREGHIKVYRAGSQPASDDADYWNGYLHDLGLRDDEDSPRYTKDDLVRAVRNIIRSIVNEALS